jgi:hypothetical protein
LNISKQIRRYVKKYTGVLHWNIKHDVKNTVLITGSPRSGSTWVEEILNFDHQYRLMFEPFHPKKVKQVQNWKFRQYFPRNHHQEQDLTTATKILSGQLRNFWVDQFNSKRIVKERLVKEVRAGLMLSWLRQNFTEMPIIYVIRNPYSVTQSRVNLKWDTNLNMYLEQNALVRDHLHPFIDIINSAKTLWEKQFVSWCIENYVPLKQMTKNDNIHTVFYESLYLNPDIEVPRLLNYLDKKANDKAFLQHKKPSAMVRVGASIENGKNPLTSWKNQVSTEQFEKSQEILRAFGLDHLYSDQGLPKLSFDEVFG